MIIEKLDIAVVGVGHVGLPLAIAFSKKYKVIGFDISEKLIEELGNGIDCTHQFSPEELKKSGIEFTTNAAKLSESGFIIITVPIPIDEYDLPDLTSLKQAVKMVGEHMKKAVVVVFESTVFPGTTEEICIPMLEEYSGFEAGVEFFVGYCSQHLPPEERKTTLMKIRKVVAGQSEEVLEFVVAIYKSALDVGIFKAKSIRVAEAAKVIENAQQDVNIALINEFSMIFNRLGIDTGDVLETAGSKKGFLKFTPGFAGGRKLGADSHYLIHKAHAGGYNPEIILASRRVNEGIGTYLVHLIAKKMMKRGLSAGARITVLGVSYKEDNNDLQNSGVIEVIWGLKDYGFNVQISDCYAESKEAAKQYGLVLTSEHELMPASAIVLAIPHTLYIERGWSMINRLIDAQGGMVFDVKGILNRSDKPPAIELWRL